MKGIILKISIYLMTLIIFTASVGVNVFKHICGECHETFYTVDMMTPSQNDECGCDGDCSCHSHSHSECLVEHMPDGLNLEVEDNQCGMDDHNHDYFHVDQLFFQYSKLNITPIITNLLVHTFEVLNTVKEWTNSDLSLRELVSSSSPDISKVNCCFII